MYKKKIENEFIYGSIWYGRNFWCDFINDFMSIFPFL